MIDIHIITCVASSERLPYFLESNQELLNSSNVDIVRLIASHDVGNCSDCLIDSSHWGMHLKHIYPLLARNIQHANQRDYHFLLNLLDKDAEEVFCPRDLRESEISLLSKHYHSMTHIDKPTLVLEDDALTLPSFLEYLPSLISLCSTLSPAYIDLGSLPNQRLCHREKILFGSSYYHLPLALTRTTIAYIINKSASELISQHYWPCSLPADLHHQYLLHRLRISGYWPSIDTFRSLTSNGKFQSTVQS